MNSGNRCIIFHSFWLIKTAMAGFDNGMHNISIPVDQMNDRSSTDQCATMHVVWNFRLLINSLTLFCNILDLINFKETKNAGSQVRTTPILNEPESTFCQSWKGASSRWRYFQVPLLTINTDNMNWWWTIHLKPASTMLLPTSSKNTRRASNISLFKLHTMTRKRRKGSSNLRNAVVCSIAK